LDQKKVNLSFRIRGCALQKHFLAKHNTIRVQLNFLHMLGEVSKVKTAAEDFQKQLFIGPLGKEVKIHSQSKGKN
jgi:hypothetical protein